MEFLPQHKNGGGSKSLLSTGHLKFGADLFVGAEEEEGVVDWWATPTRKPDWEEINAVLQTDMMPVRIRQCT